MSLAFDIINPAETVLMRIYISHLHFLKPNKEIFTSEKGVYWIFGRFFSEVRHNKESFMKFQYGKIYRFSFINFISSHEILAKLLRNY